MATFPHGRHIATSLAFLAALTAFSDVAHATDSEAYLLKRKALATDWVKRLSTKRHDRGLEHAIRASDRAPILKIVFLTPEYDLIRNGLGVVLRKAIKTVYVYKWVQTGKCYVHWDSYGYEALNGGAFTKAIGKWTVLANDFGTPAELIVPGTSGFPSGENWEVECAP